MKRNQSFRSAAPLWAALSVLVVWAALLIATAYEDGMNLFALMERISGQFARPFLIQWKPHSMKVVLICLVCYCCGIGLYYTSRENRRPGEEYGSAKWGDPKALCKKYMDAKNPLSNVILTRNVSISFNSYEHRRNLNIVVVGGSGSGKTRFVAKPWLYSANCSYIVTDPKGELLRSSGNLLKEKGYEIVVFNLIDPSQSDGYNPFAYIRNEADVLKLMDNLIRNTTPKNANNSDPFWEKAEIALDSALMLYLLHEAPPYEQNLEMITYLLTCAQVREEDEQYQSPLDQLFLELEYEKPDHIAVRQYKIFKQAAGKTAKSILISCGARLAPFDIKELRELMETDEMELDTIGDRKTALFVIISDTDDTFNFVVSILYTQLFNLLCDKADDEYGGRLPVHVRCLLDEFANIGQIPKFEKLIATIRSREISASIILQSQSQLKAIYKDNADTIVGNCDTTLFLGGKEKTTLKEISEILGKETIDSFNTSETRGRELSHGLNYQKLGKQLMTEDEIAVMDGGKCILQLRGVRPFFSDKFDITKHPKYKYLSDADPKNAFDMEKHLKRRPAIVKPDEVFDYYEIDAADLQEDADHEET